MNEDHVTFAILLRLDFVVNLLVDLTERLPLDCTQGIARGLACRFAHLELGQLVAVGVVDDSRLRQVGTFGPGAQVPSAFQVICNEQSIGQLLC